MNRDFVTQRSWLDLGAEKYILNHSVNHAVRSCLNWFYSYRVLCIITLLIMCYNSSPLNGSCSKLLLFKGLSTLLVQCPNVQGCKGVGGFRLRLWTSRFWGVFWRLVGYNKRKCQKVNPTTCLIAGPVLPMMPNASGSDPPFFHNALDRPTDALQEWRGLIIHDL